MTYTYALLPVQKSSYDEIADKLREAGYDHCFIETEDPADTRINMHGIALVPEIATPLQNSSKKPAFKIVDEVQTDFTNSIAEKLRREDWLQFFCGTAVIDHKGGMQVQISIWLQSTSSTEKGRQKTLMQIPLRALLNAEYREEAFLKEFRMNFFMVLKMWSRS